MSFVEVLHGQHFSGITVGLCLAETPLAGQDQGQHELKGHGWDTRTGGYRRQLSY